MLIKNSRQWSSKPLGVACRDSLAILVAAFVLRHALHPVMQGYAPFHFFIVACLCIALLYGYRLALLAAALSTPIGAYFFMRPFNSFGTLETVDFIQYLNFWVVTGVAIFIIERLQRAMFTRDLVLKIMDSRHHAALWRKNDHIHASRQQQAALKTMLSLVTRFQEALVIGADGGIWHVTPRWHALLAERIGDTRAIGDASDWRDHLHPDDRRLLELRLHDRTAPDRSAVVPVRLALPDGRRSAPIDLRVEHAELEDQRVTLVWLANPD